MIVQLRHEGTAIVITADETLDENTIETNFIDRRLFSEEWLHKANEIISHSTDINYSIRLFLKITSRQRDTELFNIYGIREWICDKESDDAICGPLGHNKTFSELIEGTVCYDRTPTEENILKFKEVQHWKRFDEAFRWSETGECAYYETFAEEFIFWRNVVNAINDENINERDGIPTEVLNSLRYSHVCTMTHAFVSIFWRAYLHERQRNNLMIEHNSEHIEVFDRTKFVLSECQKWVLEHPDELTCEDILNKTPLKIFDNKFSTCMIEKYDFVKDFRNILCN